MYVDNKLPREFQNFFSLPRQNVGQKNTEDSNETFAYYVGNGFGIPRHFAKCYNWFFNSWDSEKHRSQNIALFETKVINANWVITENQLKRCFLKTTGDDAKKDKKNDWNAIFTKRFYILQNQMSVFKKKEVIQLIKPIIYCDLVKGINQSTIAHKTSSN